MMFKYKYIFAVLVAVIITLYIFFTSYTEPEYLRFVEFTPSFNSTNILGLELTYVVRNNCTRESGIRAIQIVTSYAGNIEARSSLRRAYPKEELGKLGIYRVFLLAMLKPGVSEVSQNAILHETERYNDIVQGDFIENYRNLTYKHLMGIRWAVTECEADYVIKMDDDIIVDMYSLMKLVESKEKTKYDIMGYIFKDMRPIRLTANKWYVTEDEYEANSYPTFVSGWLYVLRFNSAKKLLTPLKHERYFWIDDVFVTGMLAEKVNVCFENMEEYFTTNPEYFECCMRDEVECGFIVGPSGGDYNINIDFQKHSEKCFNSNCTQYKNGKTFRNSCVVSRKRPPIGKGFAKLDVVKL
ncbi:beta-1,3-galactosyltransferase 5 [Macrosteles quadrilineatus]|uniref:beta-1,3-galactosyltransferase 5 n=1 Tax=Macrosteles quadrilineatus TaxID=74068 RepID=UPI0023E28FA7|nr:beta-1,3-galactosyltransferase 5 [Macrosteles quadrilineatus]